MPASSAEPSPLYRRSPQTPQDVGGQRLEKPRKVIVNLVPAALIAFLGLSRQPLGTRRPPAAGALEPPTLLKPG